MGDQRLRHLASIAVLSLGTGAMLVAQAPADQRARIRCFTPVSTQGVYFEVSPDGPTARLLQVTAQNPQTPQGHPPVAHAIQRRRHPDTPPLLVPVAPVSPVAPPVRRHTHGTVFDRAVAPATGCRLILP